MDTKRGTLKLRPDAVPTIFIHRPKSKRRKTPSRMMASTDVQTPDAHTYCKKSNLLWYQWTQSFHSFSHFMYFKLRLLSTDDCKFHFWSQKVSFLELNRNYGINLIDVWKLLPGVITLSSNSVLSNKTITLTHYGIHETKPTHATSLSSCSPSTLSGWRKWGDRCAGQIVFVPCVNQWNVIGHVWAGIWHGWNAQHMRHLAFVTTQWMKADTGNRQQTGNILSTII